MRFVIERASVYRRPGDDPPVKGGRLEDGQWVIDVNSLEDLLGLIDECEHDIVLNRKSITIYDDYLE